VLPLDAGVLGIASEARKGGVKYMHMLTQRRFFSSRGRNYLILVYHVRDTPLTYHFEVYRIPPRGAWPLVRRFYRRDYVTPYSHAFGDNIRAYLEMLFDRIEQYF